MTRGVALLRGINVGATKRMGMPALVRMFEGMGYTDVQAYIQSGNIVFGAASLAGTDAAIRAAIATTFGFDVPVVVRSAAEMTAVYAGSPYPGVDTGRIFVGFFDRVPDPTRVAALDPNRSPGDRFVVIGAEVWMDLGTNAHSTKLQAAWFEKKLGVAVTFRNWNTVERLAGMV